MIEIEVNGEKKGFVFGTNTFRIIRGVTGIQSMEDVMTGLGNIDKKRSQLEHVEFINDFLWSCAQDYARKMKLSMEFTTADVSDWMDEIGLQETMNIVAELIKSYHEKNLKAPRTAGLSLLKQA